MTKQTQRDPVQEVFGGQALLALDSGTLRNGVEQLQALSNEATEQISSIRNKTVDGIMQGTAQAIGAVLNPDAEMDTARRWQSAVQTALEAASKALEIVDRREKDAALNARRQQVENNLTKYQEAGAEVEKLMAKLAQALVRMDALGLNALRVSGVRLSGSTAAPFRFDHVQHMVNIGMNHYTEGLWEYPNIPQMRGYLPLSRETFAVSADVLDLFEERTEKAIGRAIDWVPATEAAAA